jgi:hypothetical protein
LDRRKYRKKKENNKQQKKTGVPKNDQKRIRVSVERS